MSVGNHEQKAMTIPTIIPTSGITTTGQTSAAMTSGVSVTPVRLFQETLDTLSTEVTTNVDTSSALPTSNGVNLSGTDTQWPFSTDLNLTPSSGLFTISSRARPELFFYDPATRTYHP
ncbi:hypothetical protein COLO4_22669, partial [Corchorus olitorius]